MHNKKPHIQSVGKIHKVLFDYLVGTSAITQDGNCPCIGILFPEVIVQTLSMFSQTNSEVSWLIPIVI